LAIERIHTYLVHPGKRSEDASTIGGTTVALSGKLFKLLDDIYARSESECDTEISFNHSESGSQQNACRDLIIEYLADPTVVRGRRLAERLEKVTTLRSGLGLLFLISGKEGKDYKIVVSRFPADSAILAEEGERAFTVEFLDRVFMKRAAAYKAAVYRDTSLTSGFWLGRAVDKQINSNVVMLSNYWIADFLNSDFRTTAAAGTRRLAVALRDASKKSADVFVKSEIAAAVTLAGKFKGRRLSIKEFEEQSGLSSAAQDMIAKVMKVPSLLHERFQFDLHEFSSQVAYRSVELDSGGMLTAEASHFDEVFHREVVNKAEQKLRFSTEGKVVGERLGKTR
jgi:hypothetical protein